MGFETKTVYLLFINDDIHEKFYEKYNLEDVFYFAYNSNFKQLLNRLISVTSIKKYESIDVQKMFENKKEFSFINICYYSSFSDIAM